MTELKIAIQHEAEARDALADIGSRIGDAANTRDEIQQQLASLEGAVLNAEAAHADAIAGLSLGEEIDAAATETALREARKALDAGAPELRHQVRVADALIERLSTRGTAAQTAYQAAAAAVKTARIEHLQAKTADLIVTTDRIVNELAEANIQLAALGGLLSEAGSPWQGSGTAIDRALQPNQLAVIQARQRFLLELDAAA
ncbi:MAG: hypothetical protein WBZ31_10435 [Thiobacillus sp.]